LDQNADSTRLYQNSASLICANCYMVLAGQGYLRLFSGFFHVNQPTKRSLEICCNSF